MATPRCHLLALSACCGFFQICDWDALAAKHHRLVREIGSMSEIESMMERSDKLAPRGLRERRVRVESNSSGERQENQGLGFRVESNSSGERQENRERVQLTSTNHRDPSEALPVPAPTTDSLSQTSPDVVLVSSLLCPFL